MRDIRKLTNAAKKIGNGEPVLRLRINREDEIGQLARTFNEMEHNLRIDKLTAVFNRESLLAQIRFLKRRPNQGPLEKTQFALLFIDLDEFKGINDHYGHDAGDQFLITVAARLKTAVRTTDVVGRYGGDEFVVLLKDVGAVSDVTAAEEKIRSIVEAPMTLQKHSVNVGVSIGWAMFPQDGRDADALMKVADSRMFDSKKDARRRADRLYRSGPREIFQPNSTPPPIVNSKLFR
ncbi:diguanylate cyclase [Undibacterium arcticum]|uniref:diguanylate cyclase n=1 Tax=Undibacterium arcticum TaxID=1762892 RepID=UPI0036244797